MSLGSLYWREPLWLLSVFLPLFIILFTYYRQKKIWQQLADADLLPWVQATGQPSRQLSSRVLLAFAWVLFSIALAGPRTPQWIPPELQAKDANVIAIIDFSSSMKARDDKISRIAQAQTLLGQWLKNAPDNLRLGLIIYAGHSHTLLKPTTDQALFQHYLGQLQQFRPPTLGNNLAAALQTAAELLKGAKGDRYILLLSDGDLGEHAGDAAKTIAAKITAEGSIKLQVIGLGQSEAVRVPENAIEFLTVDGKNIVSRRQTLWLQNFAEQAAGVYQGAEFVEQLNLTQVLDLPKPRIDPQYQNQILWDEWFFIALLGGIFLCLLALQLSIPVSSQLVNIALFLTIAGCSLPDENKDDYHDYFAQGVDCYREKDYACAQQSFSRAAWLATDEALRGRAVFNLGNSHFRLGDYEQASVLFQDAELLGIDKRKTQLNREFADSLAAAVQRRLADIAKTKQRAQWRASAHKLPEGLEDRMVEGINLSQVESKKMVFANLSKSQQNALVVHGIKRLQSTSKTSQSSSRNFWVLSAQDDLPQQTAGLFNSLMAIESGLHYVPDEPVQIKGQRPW